jgi:hypothetical protein
MKIYLAGPMRGIPEFNFPAFHAAANVLRHDGHLVFNPAENDELMEKQGVPITIRRCLEIDLAWICREADAVALLPGWQNSKGAQAERATAVALGLEVIEL